MESSEAVTVVVFGAYGHTGRFVVAELLDRGLTPILSGRDAGKLRALAEAFPGFPGLEVRPASVDDPDSLDRALDGAAVVVNCAGPFVDTAAPVIEAALRARIPYLDVAAEVEAVVDTFAQFADRARDAGVVVVPAMAFYGGLGDLLATAALGDAPAADEVHIAYALSSWQPTAGTRGSSQVSRRRREGRRLVYAKGRLELRTDTAPTGRWAFPAPVGDRAVVGEFTTADSVTIPRHLSAPDIHTFMTTEAVKDVLAPDAAPPAPVDERGRSAQTFLVDVTVRAGATRRRAVVRGQDIYAISAPLVVEGVCQVLAGRVKTAGVAAAGEIFDAHAFLGSLAPHHLSYELGAAESVTEAETGE
ncbi:saccharopine dehydrogenase NADP-binding domain-containing protein [Streptomyces sp. NBC_01565]|uniref:saccharopine dehydrogenase family protein n=1 Tax=unclassified Streptomyces TaxID=2593676 RepID=UPI00225B4E0B|nr:saccharopine dehydrogenase NADP-binding domain-containing protein [Streptomyces sp. NBC_01565]MCX4545698.1 saccharopine dehydrogenase NADP-binding domain-containing protein [Streptomyces sp. NBC_01565]